jgi:membrane fusion protein (multidrug efflux system)
MLIIGILVALAGGIFAFIHHRKTHPSTDDAYVTAHIVNIQAQVNGQVKKVFVEEHQLVKAGNPLFDLDPGPFQAAVKQADANLQNAREQMAADQMAVESAQAKVTERTAELEQTRHETQRTLSLLKPGYVSRSDADLAIRSLKVAKANLIAAQSDLKEAIHVRGDPDQENAHLRAAQAALDTALLNLSYTHVRALTAGFVENFDLRPGDAVTAYQTLFALVDNTEWWVDANFKETDLGRIRIGQKASLSLDMYPGIKFTGTVISLAQGSGASFSLLPPENATGNWVKVTQRFPVKIQMTQADTNHPLRLGASCDVEVNTTQ